MADNLSIRGSQDRLRINVNEPQEVRYWTRKLDVTPAKLREAVSAVGVMATSVQGFLAGNGAGGEKSAAVKKAAVKKTVATAKSARPQDAIALLRADHKRVSDLFDTFENSRSTNKKKALVAQICLELTVHTKIEEEIFYPAVKAALKDKEMVPEATVEHASVKDLIAQVQGIEPDGEMYDAKVKVMSEFVKHHVKEEQNEMFPKAKASRLDLVDLGAQLAARKEQLLSEGESAPGGLGAMVGAAVTRVGKKLTEAVG